MYACRMAYVGVSRATQLKDVCIVNKFKPKEVMRQCQKTPELLGLDDRMGAIALQTSTAVSAWFDSRKRKAR